MSEEKKDEQQQSPTNTGLASLLARPNILSLHPYRCARDDYDSGVLLDANENAYGPASLPSNSSIAYTDGGTHNSNPGPCGSGVFFPATATHQQTNLHYPLGWGTNNLGEIAAIGFAISHFLKNSPPKHGQLHILTDSYLAYGCLTFYWRSDLYAPLIRLIRKIISHIKHSNPVTIHWIAGHAGIAGNESAVRR